MSTSQRSTFGKTLAETEFCAVCGSVLLLPTRGSIAASSVVRCGTCSTGVEAGQFNGIAATTNVEFNSRELARKAHETSKHRHDEAVGPVVERKCWKCGHEKVSDSSHRCHLSLTTRRFRCRTRRCRRGRLTKDKPCSTRASTAARKTTRTVEEQSRAMNGSQPIQSRRTIAIMQILVPVVTKPTVQLRAEVISSVDVFDLSRARIECSH